MMMITMMMMMIMMMMMMMMIIVMIFRYDALMQYVTSEDYIKVRNLYV